MNKRKRRGLSALDELAAHVAAVLIEEGLTQARAIAIGSAAAERMRQLWGGYEFYFPKINLAKMRAEIHRRWDGTNTRELCDEFGVSSRRLRQLDAEARRRSR